MVLLVTSDTLGPALTKLQAGGLLHIPTLVAMASTLLAMACTLLAMANKVILFERPGHPSVFGRPFSIPTVSFLR